jgi:predicted DNA-binding transcriptional regulator AlpA
MTLRRMIRRKQLREFLALGETQLAYHERHDPDFPKSVPLSSSGRARGFFVDEIEAYQRRMADARTGQRRK